MLVRVDERLRAAVLRVGPTTVPKREDPESYITVVTGEGVRRIRVQNEERAQKREEAELEEMSFIAELVPEWMRDALAEGGVLGMPKEEYFSLPPEVTEYLDVLSY